MNQFVNSIEDTSNVSETLNGAITLYSSLNPCVDLFFLIGSSRGKDIRNVFDAAYAQNPDIATRILLWSRDIRGGAGERKTFRNLLLHCERTHPEVVQKILHLIPLYGRWDDTLIFQTDNFKNQAYSLIEDALNHDSTKELVAKWLPRPNKDKIANEIRKFLKLTPKAYRKLLVNTSNTIEQLICSNRLEEIEFSKVPSVASQKYGKLFAKKQTERFQDFLDSVKKGESKINASAIFPHDVVKEVFGNHYLDPLTKTNIKWQWKALPFETKKSILPMIDVSGSMITPISGSTTALQVAVSLGLFVSERNKNVFQDCFLTFSTNPELQKLSNDSIVDKLNQIRKSNWGMSTNLQAAFELILSKALENRVLQEDLPEYLLILSDMEFNSCVTPMTNHENIKQKFVEAGYEIPKLIFWNLNARKGNVPVSFKENGTCLVSGYSQNLLNSILNFDGEDFNPESIMMKTVGVSRYDTF